MHDEKQQYVFKENGICTLGNRGKYHCQNRWHRYVPPKNQACFPEPTQNPSKMVLNHMFNHIFPIKFKQIPRMMTLHLEIESILVP